MEEEKSFQKENDLNRGLKKERSWFGWGRRGEIGKAVRFPFFFFLFREGDGRG
jgi:hypothetical protein